MSDGATDKAKGTMNEVKGQVKQAAGDATDNESMQSSGKMDEMKGKAQQGMGKVKDKVDDLTDKHS